MSTSAKRQILGPELQYVVGLTDVLTGSKRSIRNMAALATRGYLQASAYGRMRTFVEASVDAVTDKDYYSQQRH